MKKILFLIVIVAIAWLGISTCPLKSQHKETLMKLVDVALDEKLTKEAKNETQMGIAVLRTIIGSEVAEYLLEKKLMVDNYFVCSIGTVTYDGEEHIVSVGAFNHVFSINEDKLKQALKK